MKKILSLAVIFWATSTFGQAAYNLGKLPGSILTTIDTTLQISYVSSSPKEKLPLVYINGKRGNLTFLNSIFPKLIDSINVIRDSVKIGDAIYYGQIHVKTKSSYNPKLISLAEVKEKYTNLQKEPAIFIVDGQIVSGHYDEFIVDESRLWRIFIHNLTNEKGKPTTLFINLLTKSEENFKKVPSVEIRGEQIGLKN